jgi:hypothetical protein
VNFSFIGFWAKAGSVMLYNSKAMIMPQTFSLRYVVIAESPSESRINQWRREGKTNRDAPGISRLLEALNAPDGCTFVLFAQR